MLEYISPSELAAMTTNGKLSGTVEAEDDMSFYRGVSTVTKGEGNISINSGETTLENVSRYAALLYRKSSSTTTIQMWANVAGATDHVGAKNPLITVTDGMDEWSFIIFDFGSEIDLSAGAGWIRLDLFDGETAVAGDTIDVAFIAFFESPDAAWGYCLEKYPDTAASFIVNWDGLKIDNGSAWTKDYFVDKKNSSRNAPAVADLSEVVFTTAPDNCLKVSGWLATPGGWNGFKYSITPAGAEEEGELKDWLRGGNASQAILDATTAYNFDDDRCIGGNLQGDNKYIDLTGFEEQTVTVKLYGVTNAGKTTCILIINNVAVPECAHKVLGNAVATEDGCMRTCVNCGEYSEVVDHTPGEVDYSGASYTIKCSGCATVMYEQSAVSGAVDTIVPAIEFVYETFVGNGTVFFSNGQLLNENGEDFARFYGNGRGDAYMTVYGPDASGVTGQYLIIKYRVPSENAARAIWQFWSCTGSHIEAVTGCKNFYYEATKDNEWHIVVLNLAEKLGTEYSAAEDGTYSANYLRIDIMDQVHSAAEYVDVAYAAFASDLSDVVSFVSSRGDDAYCDHAMCSDYIHVTGNALEIKSCMVCGTHIARNTAKVTNIDFIKVDGNQIPDTNVVGTGVHTFDGSEWTLNNSILVHGWGAVNGGIAGFKYSTDGGNTWYDCVTNILKFESEAIVKAILGKDSTMKDFEDSSRYQFVMNIGHLDNSSFDLLIGAVPAENDTAVVPILKITGLSIACKHDDDAEYTNITNTTHDFDCHDCGHSESDVKHTFGELVVEGNTHKVYCAACKAMISETMYGSSKVLVSSGNMSDVLVNGLNRRDIGKVYVAKDAAGFGYVSVWGAETGADPYFQFYKNDGTAESGQYLIYKIRTNTGSSLTLFCGVTNDGPVGGDEGSIPVHSDGKWHTYIVNLADLMKGKTYEFTPGEENKYYAKYLRFDHFIGTTNYLDIAYVATAASLNEALAFVEDESVYYYGESKYRDENISSSTGLLSFDAKMLKGYLKDTNWTVSDILTYTDATTKQSVDYVNVTSSVLSGEIDAYLYQGSSGLLKTVGQYIVVMYRRNGSADWIDFFPESTEKGAIGSAASTITSEGSADWIYAVLDADKSTRYDSSTGLMSIRMDVFNKTATTRDIDIAFVMFFDSYADAQSYISSKYSFAKCQHNIFKWNYFENSSSTSNEAYERKDCLICGAVGLEIRKALARTCINSASAYYSNALFPKGQHLENGVVPVIDLAAEGVRTAVGGSTAVNTITLSGGWAGLNGQIEGMYYTLVPAGTAITKDTVWVSTGATVTATTNTDITNAIADAKMGFDTVPFNLGAYSLNVSDYAAGTYDIYFSIAPSENIVGEMTSKYIVFLKFTNLIIDPEPNYLVGLDCVFVDSTQYKDKYVSANRNVNGAVIVNMAGVELQNYTSLYPHGWAATDIKFVGNCYYYKVLNNTTGEALGSEVKLAELEMGTSGGIHDAGVEIGLESDKSYVYSFQNSTMKANLQAYATQTVTIYYYAKIDDGKGGTVEAPIAIIKNVSVPCLHDGNTNAYVLDVNDPQRQNSVCSVCDVAHSIETTLTPNGLTLFGPEYLVAHSGTSMNPTLGTDSNGLSYVHVTSTKSSGEETAHIFQNTANPISGDKLGTYIAILYRNSAKEQVQVVLEGKLGSVQAGVRSFNTSNGGSEWKFDIVEAGTTSGTNANGDAYAYDGSQLTAFRVDYFNTARTAGSTVDVAFIAFFDSYAEAWEYCAMYAEAYFGGITNCQHTDASQLTNVQAKTGDLLFSATADCAKCGATSVDVPAELVNGNSVYGAGKLFEMAIETGETSFRRAQFQLLKDSSTNNMPYVHYTSTLCLETWILINDGTQALTTANNYFAVLYRTSNHHCLELFVTKNGQTGPGTHSNKQISTKQGGWQLAVWPIGDWANYDKSGLGWTRLDVLNPNMEYADEMDIAFAGFFADMEAVEDYYGAYLTKYLGTCTHPSSDYNATADVLTYNKVCANCGLAQGTVTGVTQEGLTVLTPDKLIGITATQDGASGGTLQSTITNMVDPNYNSLPFMRVEITTGATHGENFININKGQSTNITGVGKYVAIIYRSNSVPANEMFISSSTAGVSGGQNINTPSPSFAANSAGFQLSVFNFSDKTNWNASTGIGTIRWDMNEKSSVGDYVDVACIAFFNSQKEAEAFYARFVEQYQLNNLFETYLNSFQINETGALKGDGDFPGAPFMYDFTNVTLESASSIAFNAWFAAPTGTDWYNLCIIDGDNVVTTEKWVVSTKDRTDIRDVVLKKTYVERGGFTDQCAVGSEIGSCTLDLSAYKGKTVTVQIIAQTKQGKSIVAIELKNITVPNS